MDIVLTQHHVLGTSGSAFGVFLTHGLAGVALRSAPHHRRYTMGRGPDTFMVHTRYLSIAFQPGYNLFPPASLALGPRYMVPKRICILAHATRRILQRALCRLVP